MNGRKPNLRPYKIAILWRCGAEARRAATPQDNRFHRVFEELAVVVIHAEPAVYDEEFADEVREELLAADGVLVWVDPIHQGKTRTALDPLLRDVAARGPWVMRTKLSRYASSAARITRTQPAAAKLSPGKWLTWIKVAGSNVQHT
jgi:hypothetical protein